METVLFLVIGVVLSWVICAIINDSGLLGNGDHFPTWIISFSWITVLLLIFVIITVLCSTFIPNYPSFKRKKK